MKWGWGGMWDNPHIVFLGLIPQQNPPQAQRAALLLSHNNFPPGPKNIQVKAGERHWINNHGQLGVICYFLFKYCNCNYPFAADFHILCFLKPKIGCDS